MIGLGMPACNPQYHSFTTKGGIEDTRIGREAIDFLRSNEAFAISCYHVITTLVTNILRHLFI